MRRLDRYPIGMKNTIRRSTLALLLGASALTACEYDDFERESDVLAESAEAYASNGAALQSNVTEFDRALQMLGLESEAYVEGRLREADHGYYLIADASRRGIGGEELAAIVDDAEGARDVLRQHVALITQPYGARRLPDGVPSVDAALKDYEGAVQRGRNQLR